MRVVIEVLAISEPRDWGDRRVAFEYKLGISGGLQEGWLIEGVYQDSLGFLPSILAEYVNMTRPPGKLALWLRNRLEGK